MRIEFLPPVVALVTSAACALVLLRAGLLPMDLPNERSSHRRPVPRAGGLAIWAGWGAALLAAGRGGAWLWPALTLAAVSLVDDHRGLPVVLRLPVHLLAALAFVLACLPDAPWALQGALVIAAIWMLNLFNFMDGADGLAASAALLGFSSLALASLLAGDDAFFGVLASLAAACLGFLWLNWSPAKVFMGDVGSIPLGFLAAALGIDGWARGAWFWWLPVLVFLPVIADATVTIIRRTLRGERIWRAHREHAYQTLIRHGWSHRRVAGSYAALAAGCAASALALQRTAPDYGGWLLLVWSMVLGGLYLWVMRRFPSRSGVADAV